MTIERRADMVLPAVLDDLAGYGNLDYLDDVLLVTARTRQPRAWASIQRWLPAGGPDLVPALPWRGLVLALVILALLIASLALVVGAPRNRLAPPFGLADTGLVAFESAGDLVATLPDGTGRRALISGPGLQWGIVWSHRGDRFAYWSAPTTSDPASLWVADRDGSSRHLVSGNLTTPAGDLIPQVSWSPDDGRLVFSVGPPQGTQIPSELYVVNADGTNLTVIGDGTHQRANPIWSPNGSLLAYTGQPNADPNSTTSTWVIAPNGTGDVEVIPAEGPYEIANVDPSWSLDGRSVLVHTGGASASDGDTDISIAQQDAAGHWSHSKLVSGGWDYLPSFSTDGTRFTFLQLLGGTDPAEYVVMVADADGANVHQLSAQHVGFATPCWSPDDRSIRAFGLGQGADATILLFPIDGSPPLDIPAPGASSTAGCQMQRLAP